MRHILGLCMGMFMAVACGDGSGAGAGGNLCGKALAKVDSCGFHNLASKAECSELEEAEDACYTNCALSLPCSAFTAAYCHQDYSGFVSCLKQCEPAPYLCADGEQVDGDARCDGFESCNDGSDEAGCPTTDCGDGNTFVQNEKCDGFEACSNGADEAGCPGSITCGDGSSVGEHGHCDGFDDCPDGEDEAGCVLVTCSDGTTYPESFQCDGFDDCEDGSDEAGCSGTGGNGGVDPEELVAIDCQTLP